MNVDDFEKTISLLKQLTEANDSAAIARIITTRPVEEILEFRLSFWLNYGIESNNLLLCDTALKLGARTTDDETGDPPLRVALLESDAKIVETLLEHGANPNARMLNDEVGLHLAAQMNQMQKAQLLVNHGADVNVPTRIDQFYTPLMIAASAGNREMVEFLLRHNADWKWKNCLDESAPSVAARSVRDVFQRLFKQNKGACGKKLGEGGR